MSLVGPRPLLPEYLKLYSHEQLRRHDVRPGITGWAQVNGRNDVAWEERLARDAWYVDHYSLWLDIRIMLATAWQILQPRGIAMPGHATMPRFAGQQHSEFHAGRNSTGYGRNAIVIGAGGHAKVVISALHAAGWRVEAAYDDDPTKLGQRILGVEIRGPISDLDPQSPTRAVIALGDAALRRSIAFHFGFDWITAVHPTAWVDPTATVGPGVVVCAGAVIQPGCRIGRHAIVNTQAGIDHDCRIGDFAHVGPGANLAGGVRIGADSLIGTGANVIPGICVGARTTVGAGATVIDDLPDDIVAVGCPARVTRYCVPTEAAATSFHEVY
jgi:sugar O-acyltransferase (sialic acid O-acetyltransferase NeuD family)